MVEDGWSAALATGELDDMHRTELRRAYIILSSSMQENCTFLHFTEETLNFMRIEYILTFSKVAQLILQARPLINICTKGGPKTNGLLRQTL